VVEFKRALGANFAFELVDLPVSIGTRRAVARIGLAAVFADFTVIARSAAFTRGLVAFVLELVAFVAHNLLCTAVASVTHWTRQALTVVRFVLFNGFVLAISTLSER
jgi:hypothetical protein